MSRLTLHTRPQLPPITELVPEVEAVVEAAHAVLGQPRLPFQGIDIGRLCIRMRHEEETRTVGNRQVYLTRDQRRLAHLQIPHPLTARLCDLRQHKTRGSVVTGISLEII